MTYQFITQPLRNNRPARARKNRRIVVEERPMSNLSGFFVFVLVLLLLCVNGWGCASAPPPEHFSVDSDFSESEAAVVRDVMSAWCDAVAYCPDEVLQAERGAVNLVADLDDRGMAAGDVEREVVARNSGDAIRVAANRKYDSLQVLWVSVAHEVGHYCTEHTASGLMGALQMTDAPLEIDKVAIDAWHAGCP